MTRFDGPVVVGLDGSPRIASSVTAAVELGAWEAVRRHVDLNLVYGYEPSPPWAYTGPDSDPDAARRASDRRMLDRAVADATAAHPALVVDGGIHVGGTAGALVAASSGASLVIVCADARVHYGGLQAGLVSVQVAAYAQAPVVVVVAPRDRPAAADRALVVVGIDGSPGSDDAVAFAVEEAHARDGRLCALYAWDVDTADDPPEAVDRMLHDSTAGWRSKYPDVPVSHDAVGAVNPVRALHDAARYADLVVVGARGRGGFPTLPLGSVSDGLVRYAATCVAVVPGR